MTEVINTPVVAGEAIFFDSIGNPYDFQGYLDYEYSEAQQYLGEGDKNKQPRTPRSILALIAACGTPGYTDFSIKFSIRYAHYDDEVFDAAMACYTAEGLIVPTESKVEQIPKHAQTTGRRTEIRTTIYELTDLAFELLPKLKEVQAAEKPQNRPKPKISKLSNFALRCRVKLDNALTISTDS